MEGLGLEASPMARPIEERELDDYKASSPPAALGRALATWLDRAQHEVSDVREGLAASRAGFSPRRGRQNYYRLAFL